MQMFLQLVVLLSALTAFAAEPDQVRAVRVRNVELHYVERGEGVPAVFIHGAIDDYRCWEGQMEHFAQH
jgi:hypothetical protein